MEFFCVPVRFALSCRKNRNMPQAAVSAPCMEVYTLEFDECRIL